MKITRACSIPIITHDPYFSIWSPADRLYDADLEHWSGIRQQIRGYLTAGAETFCFMGNPEFHRTLPQTGLSVTATSTEYTFRSGETSLTVRFTSPLLLQEPLLVSRPCSYVEFTLQAQEDARITLVFSDDLVQCTPGTTSGGSFDAGSFRYAVMGRRGQKPLGNSGDSITADWGYLYIASDLPEAEFQYDHTGQNLYATFSLKAGSSSTHMVVAYDDLLSVNYMGQWRRALWTETYCTILSAIGAALTDRRETLQKAAALDRDIEARASAWGGSDYAFLCVLSYRQSIAAHKLVKDEHGNLLFLSKENDSNGCICTVDVSYPSVPLYLLYSSEYVKGMLRPIFAFAACPVWEYDFAPHDMGRYPYAWGQVYGMNDYGFYAQEGDIFPPFCQYPAGSGIYSLRNQMPLEECGNMLIMTAAVCIRDGCADFAVPYLETLQKWIGYLEKYGADPEDQLCTDDFAGHLKRNANLSVKAIMGIEAYSRILSLMGQDLEAQNYHLEAARMAQNWEKMALAGDHYSLTFDNPDSWSLKYNLVWDKLFGSHLFSDTVFEKESACYLAKANAYGTPLDSRQDYTKSDWLLWCASFCPSREQACRLIHPVKNFLENSPSRVPFSDWYFTSTGIYRKFRGRSVQGGIFMPLLMDAGL